MKIDMQVTGLDKLRAQLSQFSDRRFNATLATALTRTAVEVSEAARQDMTRAFDRPTPYTLRAMRYVAATADKPVAVVGFNVAAIQDAFGNVVRYQDLGPGSTQAGKYLQFQIDGGRRREKRFEQALRMVGVLPAGWLAVPGERANLDAYGNQSIGEIRQILSWFDAAELVAGSRQNMRQAGRDRRIKGTRKRAGFEYFVVDATGRRGFVRASGSAGTHKMQPGIYRRTFMAMGSRLEPVVIFVRDASYRPRWDFHGMAKRIADQRLRPNVERAIGEQLARQSSAAATR